MYAIQQAFSIITALCLLSGCQAVQQSAVNLFEALGGEPFDGVHLANRYSKRQVHGWSQGYAPDGALRSRIYYERGQATRWEQYDAHGNKTAHGDFAP